MSQQPEDKKFEQFTKRLLDDSAENLDGGLQSRLTQARFRALEQKSTTSWLREWIPKPIPAFAAAAGLALALVFTLNGPTQNQSGSTLEDLELLATTDQLELYEDMEFYAWLAEENSAEPYETG